MTTYFVLLTALDKCSVEPYIRATILKHLTVNLELMSLKVETKARRRDRSEFAGLLEILPKPMKS